jgi:hypothetical protein
MSKDKNTVRLKCSKCGKPIPCPDHTGTDGESIDHWVPEKSRHGGRGEKN